MLRAVQTRPTSWIASAASADSPGVKDGMAMRMRADAARSPEKSIRTSYGIRWNVSVGVGRERGGDHCGVRNREILRNYSIV